MEAGVRGGRSCANVVCACTYWVINLLVMRLVVLLVKVPHVLARQL